MIQVFNSFKFCFNFRLYTINNFMVINILNNKLLNHIKCINVITNKLTPSSKNLKTFRKKRCYLQCIVVNRWAVFTISRIVWTLVLNYGSGRGVHFVDITCARVDRGHFIFDICWPYVGLVHLVLFQALNVKSWSKQNYKMHNNRSHTPMITVGPCTDHYTSFSYGFDFIFDGTGLNCFFLGANLTGGSDVPKNINCHFFNSPTQIVRLFIKQLSTTTLAV